ncbi:MAG: glycosyltransferase family 4 protein [Anaerolineae bacterium]
MRVLMFSWEYPPYVVGGLGAHVDGLLPALTDRGVEVHLLTPRFGGGERVERVGRSTIHRIDTPSPSGDTFFADARRTNQALERAALSILSSHGPFDLIHNHDWLTSFAAIDLKLKHKLPLVATIHATERGRGRGSLNGEQPQRINDTEWRLTYEAWRVICCSRYMTEEVLAYFGTPEDKMDVIPNGIDTHRFDAPLQEDLVAFRAGYAEPDEKLVLYVGRIVHEKGVEVLVRAAPRVLAEEPRTRFVIAGKGPDFQHIQDLVEETGLSERVLLPGFVSDEDRDRLLVAADCAVFPSLYEPFGIVALEAMAAHTPLVVSEVGGFREFVQHGETGVTVYPNNPDSCAWGILHTLQYPEWAQMRVENAHDMVCRIYNWDTIAAQTRDVYARVIAERQRTDW